MTQGVRARIAIGAVFGRLTVIGHGPSSRHGRLWHCRCECGGITDQPSNRLTSGTVRSCGCLRRERMAGLWRSEEHRQRWHEAVAKANVKKARREKAAKPKEPPAPAEKPAAFDPSALTDLEAAWKSGGS
jgi:hypothetical protein